MSNAGSRLGGPRGRVTTFTGKSRATAQTGSQSAYFSHSRSVRSPWHDRHGADGVGGRTADDPRTYADINQRVVFLVEHPVNAGSLEDDTRFLGEYLLVVR